MKLRQSNKSYWDKRYKTGGTSGLGSVGNIRDWKWEIIHQYTNADSVLDVGCGDMSFWEGKKCADYLGLDISPHIIRKLQKEHPWGIFICSNAKEKLDISKPVVLCLDLIFHITDEKTLEKIIFNLITWSTDLIFIFNWDDKPNQLQSYHQKYHNLLEKVDLFNKNDFNLIAQHSCPYTIGSMYVFKLIQSKNK